MNAAYQKASLMAREDDRCGSGDADQDYNMGLHIFAVFLIMICGTVACSFPTVVKAYPRLAISKHALFVCRHFGTGVLIALAFAHLLPTAFENLWDECLPYFWTDGYDAMPGFLAMLAALAIMLVEMGFTWKGFHHTHTVEILEARVEGLQIGGTGPSNVHEVSSPDNISQARSVIVPACANGDRGETDSACPGGTSQQGAETGCVTQMPEDNVPRDKAEGSQVESLPLKQQEQRMILQCLLLEAGILFHSVFIGLSISLSTGTTFIALMVAISFHQIFEGLALGARIAAVASFRVSNPKPWVMSFAVRHVPENSRGLRASVLIMRQYGLTCPLGQMIGLGLRKTYNPDGQTALLVVGIANAISVGTFVCQVSLRIRAHTDEGRNDHVCRASTVARRRATE